MIARSADVWVLTRANNRASVEYALCDLPERERLHFVYIDLPTWAMRWKRGQRGVRLYYVFWQFAALRAALRLHRTVSFDVAWHLTLANAWLGSAASFARLPFIYGPVGGGIGMPWRLVPVLGLKGAAYELLRAAARAVSRYLSPLPRASWRRANLILVQNRETLDWLPARHRTKSRIVQHAVVAGVERCRDFGNAGPVALFAGRLIPWKGGELALRALADAPRWRLLVCGEGNDRVRLEGIAQELSILDRVEFCGNLSRSDLADLMGRVDALLHPSLHDDAPLVVTEALSHGLPIVCLDRGGPPVLAGDAGLTVRSAHNASTVSRELAAALEKALAPGARARAWERAAELTFERMSVQVAELLAAVTANPRISSPPPMLAHGEDAA